MHYHLSPFIQRALTLQRQRHTTTLHKQQKQTRTFKPRKYLKKIIPGTSLIH